MRQSTIITLGASVAFGILAVVLARGWINDAIRDEYSRQGNTVASQVKSEPAVAMVPVVVVDVDMNFGDVVTPELLRVVEFPQDALPAGTYETLNSIFVDPSQPTVVLRRMALNEPVLDYKITGPGARGSLSALITEGMRAVSVRVNEVNGVAGFVMPGDYVDVIYTRDEESRRNGNNLQADILLQNVKVLGIDQILNDMRAKPNVARTVTLEVTNVDGQKLHLAQDAGRLSLTLRRAGDMMLESTKSVAQKSLLQTPQSHAPIRPVRRLASKTPTTPSNLAEVTVIRGEERDQVKVIKDPNTENEDEKLAGGTL